MYTWLFFAGKKACKYGGSRFYHFRSQTIKSDEILLKNNSKTHSKCQLYFSEKWGYAMTEDIEKIKTIYFKHPYGEGDKPLSYWRPPANVELNGKFKEALPLSVQFSLFSISSWMRRTKNRIKHHWKVIFDWATTEVLLRAGLVPACFLLPWKSLYQ